MVSQQEVHGNYTLTLLAHALRPTATDTPAVTIATRCFFRLLSSSETGTHSSLPITVPHSLHGFTLIWNSARSKLSTCSCDTVSLTSTTSGARSENCLQCFATCVSSSASSASRFTPMKNTPFSCSWDYASLATPPRTCTLQQYSNELALATSKRSTTPHSPHLPPPHRSHTSMHCHNPSLFDSPTSVHYASLHSLSPTSRNFKSVGAQRASWGSTHSVVSIGESTPSPSPDSADFIR